METPTDRSQTPQGETGSPRVAAGPAICDPGRHVSGSWCSRCGQWFVDGEWRNTPPETTQLDPADVHSDDAMLSAVASEGITPLTPVAEEIRVVLNRYSAEAPSGTPDYILANYLIDCLKAFNEAVSLRAVWRGEPIEQMVRHIDKER